MGRAVIFDFYERLITENHRNGMLRGTDAADPIYDSEIVWGVEEEISLHEKGFERIMKCQRNINCTF